MSSSQNYRKDNQTVKIAVSLLGLLLAILHSLKILNIDTQALILLALAFVPWLTNILSEAELPGGWKLKFIQQIKDEQERQRDDIEQLKFLIEGFVTESELNILRKLSSSEPYLVKVDNTTHFFSSELDRLRRLGLISNPQGRGRSSLLVNDGKSREVKEHFYITDKGKNYLKFRDSDDTDET